MTNVQASDGGLIHHGVYDGEVAGWHPACGDTGADRWFGCPFPITCVRCLTGVAANPSSESVKEVPE